MDEWRSQGSWHTELRGAGGEDRHSACKLTWEALWQARDYFFTTARTLLSILRQSQALARLRFASEVEQVRLSIARIGERISIARGRAEVHEAWEGRALAAPAAPAVISWSARYA